MQDWASGLAYMHGKGFVHRDIKPSNLGITSYKNPRGFLLDLNLATSDLGIVVDEGTDSYYALEIVLVCDLAEDERQRNKADLMKADMWALGLGAYALITNKEVDWFQYDDDNDEGADFARLDYATKPRLKKLFLEFDRMQKDGRGEDVAYFIDLCRQLLRWNPRSRPSAKLMVTRMNDVSERVGSRDILPYWK